MEVRGIANNYEGHVVDRPPDWRIHVEGLEGVGSRDHFVQFYEDDDFLVDSVAAFIGAGLGAGEAAIVIATSAHRKALSKRLIEQGVHLAAVEARGQYLALDASQTLSQFMVAGAPDKSLFNRVIGSAIVRTGKNHPGLRAFGEMVALLWADGNGKAAIALEELWNELGKRHSFSLFCAYPMNGFGDAANAADFQHICHTHSHVLPPQQFSTLTTEAERQREIAALQQKALALEKEISRREESERKLHRREAELSDFVENASIGLHWVGPDGVIQWANKADFEMLGYMAEEYIGRDIAEFHADAHVIEDILTRLKAGERLRDYEARLKAKDGSIRTVLIDSSVLWENGQFLHTQCFTRDITERKQAEEELVKSRKELALQVQDLQHLHEQSILSGRRSLNETLEELLGAALEVHGTDRGMLSLFSPDSQTLRVAANRGFGEEFLEKVRNVPVGTGACGNCFKDKKRVIIEDTESNPLFAPYRDAAKLGGFRAVHSTPLSTRAGKLIGVLSVHFTETRRPSEREIRLMDLYARQAADTIEEAKWREENLRTQEVLQRLAAIVESSDDAIISKDLNSIITTWNRGAEEIFGYTAQEVIGKPITILMPPERIDEEPGILARIRKGEKVDHYETVRRRKDGTLFDVSLTVSPVRDATGKVVGASQVARDISDRIRVREKLEQTVAERTAQLRDTVAELEAFSYSVAHDMRAPLRSMNSYSRILEQDYGPLLPADGKNFLRRIGVSAARLDALITDVLNYSKVSRGEMPVEKVDVEKLTREIVESYPELQEAGAMIFVQSPIPPVMGNTAALTQCISNLLSNAVKFVARDTAAQVRVRAENKGEHVRLWFEDNGIGISEEGRKRIFRMFQRLNPAREFEGTGIGLTIVRKAVERMGGQVGVESTLGVGSQFWIELKRAA